MFATSSILGKTEDLPTFVLITTANKTAQKRHWNCSLPRQDMVPRKIYSY